MLSGRQVCPLAPEIPSPEIRRLRAALILEEAFETISALGFSMRFTQSDGVPVCVEFIEFRDTGLFDEIARVGFGDDSPFTLESVLRPIADGCADLKVVTVGTEIACGINGKPIFEEVMRSNMTKDFTGAQRGDGKILKGKNYTPPDLEPILKSQMKQI